MTMMQTRMRLLGAAAVVATVLAGCGVAEENPLNVNAARQAPAGSVEGAPAGSTAQGEDPLNIGADGAKLCGVQPKESFQEYTVMLHNPTLEVFTFGDITLGSAEGLRVVSAEITPANREGHGHHGAGAEVGADSHGGHGAAPAPSTKAPEPSTFLVEPVPADGYRFEPDSHINIVVAVALEEGVDNGTAENILVQFASTERDYAVPHNLSIEIDRKSCS